MKAVFRCGLMPFRHRNTQAKVKCNFIKTERARSLDEPSETLLIQSFLKAQSGSRPCSRESVGSLAGMRLVVAPAGGRVGSGAVVFAFSGRNFVVLRIDAA